MTVIPTQLTFRGLPHSDALEAAVRQRVAWLEQFQAGKNRIYVHRASVLDDAFDELTVGTPVAFVEERGEKGPQASTVRVLGKHHYVAPPG